MMYDLATKENTKLKDFWDVAEFFKKNSACAEMLSKVVKYIKLFLAIPTTSSTAGTIFFSLLRSTMGQERLNNIAILNDITVNIDDLAEEFIKG